MFILYMRGIAGTSLPQLDNCGKLVPAKSQNNTIIVTIKFQPDCKASFQGDIAF